MKSDKGPLNSRQAFEVTADFEPVIEWITVSSNYF